MILPFLRSSDRRRVVFATPTWQISGVNTFIETLVRELNKRDFEASILFTTPYAMTLDKSLLPDVPTKILSTRQNLRPRQLRKLLKEPFGDDVALRFCSKLRFRRLCRFDGPAS